MDDLLCDEESCPGCAATLTGRLDHRHHVTTPAKLSCQLKLVVLLLKEDEEEHA